MRRIICIGMVILTAIVSAKAQNDVLFSQHMLNRLAYNPAVTGASRYVNVSGNFRDQWHGWRGAPRATAVNIHNYFDALRSGVGITVSHNEMGLEQNLNIKALYAYHVILSEKSYLSLGISGGILYRYFDRDKIYSEDMTDTDLLLYLDKKSYVDFDFGIEYNTEHFIAGASITHLTNAQQKDGMMYIGRHYYAFAKYLFQLNPDWRIEPSFFMQNRKNLRNFEVNALTNYKEKVSVGLSYRVNADFKGVSVIPIASCVISEYLSLGYSYDILIGDFKKYGSGTHEITLNVRIPKNHRRYYKSPRFFE